MGLGRVGKAVRVIQAAHRMAQQLGLPGLYTALRAGECAAHWAVGRVDQQLLAQRQRQRMPWLRRVVSRYGSRYVSRCFLRRWGFCRQHGAYIPLHSVTTASTAFVATLNRGLALGHKPLRCCKNGL